MSAESKKDVAPDVAASQDAATRRPNITQFPGLMAICLYLLLLAVDFIVNVAAHQAPWFYLVFAAAFFTSVMGLTMLLRWAWALAIGGVALLSASFLVTFSTQHEASALVQGMLNLVFFLYLVRQELREKLR